MKRSRLSLFRTTSLTISLIAVILILITVIVVAYIGVSEVTDTVSTSVSSGSTYDNLNQIKSDYADLTQQYDALNEKLGTSPENTTKMTYNEGKLKLTEVNQTISSLESSINRGEDQATIDKYTDEARSQLNEARDVYNQLA